MQKKERIVWWNKQKMERMPCKKKEKVCKRERKKEILCKKREMMSKEREMVCKNNKKKVHQVTSISIKEENFFFARSSLRRIYYITTHVDIIKSHFDLLHLHVLYWGGSAFDRVIIVIIIVAYASSGGGR